MLGTSVSQGKRSVHTARHIAKQGMDLLFYLRGVACKSVDKAGDARLLLRTCTKAVTTCASAWVVNIAAAGAS